MAIAELLTGEAEDDGWENEVADKAQECVGHREDPKDKACPDQPEGKEIE